MFKNVTGQKIQLFAFDTTTGAAKTGDATNITAYVSKDHGAPVALGDTTATELDSTNAKGVYLFDLTQAETSADELTFTAVSTTANISITPRFISTVPAKFTTLVIDSAGLVDANVVKVGPSGSGTAQTAGDLTAQLTAIDDYVDTEVAAIKAKTDQLTFTVANQVDVNVVDWKGSAAPAMTGDAYARLGAPAGASVSADIAAVKTDTAAVKAKTDNLPSDPADESLVIAATDAIAALIGSPAGASVSADVAAVKSDTTAIKTYADRTVARGTVSATSPTTTSFTSSALSPAGVDADQFKGRIIVFDNDTTTTALRGQATDITANTGAANPQFTFSALTTAPQSGDTFSIV